MAVTVTINGVDRTALIALPRASIEKQANRMNGIFSFVLSDDARVTGGTPITLRERQEVIVVDGATTIFGGQIATLRPSIDGVTIVWQVKCQSFDSLLDHRIIESLVRTGTRTDQAEVQALLAYHTAIESATFVSNTISITWDIDYGGLTIRQALDKLAREVGGRTYWIDDLKKAHWGDPLTVQKVQNTGWDAGSGSNWALDGSAVVTANAGPGGTGDHALITTGNGSGRHESTQTVTGIVGNRRYLFFADGWQSAGTNFSIRLDWQNSSSVSQRIDVIDGTGGGTSTWFRKKAVYAAPAAATKVIVMLGGANNFTGTVRHDNMNLAEQTAAWGVHTTPDNSTTYAVTDFEYPTDATKPINRLLVKGSSISEWREFQSSISYYGGAKFEGILNDPDASTSADIDKKAAAVFRKYAFPRHGGRYKTWRAGLDVGVWQIVQHEVMGHEAVEWIASMKISFLGNGNALYDVTLGEPEDDIGQMISTLSGSFQSGSDISLPPPPGVDTTAPAVPTGLDLTSSQQLNADGTLMPYLLATWNAVGDADLDAYELQIDRAIDGDVAFVVSASGSGGSLAAGLYSVTITGLGAVQGESFTDTVVQQQVNAGQRLFVNITAKAGISSYKIYATRAEVPLANGQTTATTGSDVEITSEGAGAAPPAISTAFAFLNPTPYRTQGTSVYTEDVRANWHHAARVRAVDGSGNASNFSSIDTVLSAKDTSAPSIPTALAAVPGFRLVGLSWARNAEADLLTYEVRFSPDIGTGDPDPELWVSFRQDTTVTIVNDLEPDVLYFFQVRAIDRSGNVQTSAGDPTAVSAVSNPEAGWSNVDPDYETATPTLVGAADVSFNSVLTEILNTNQLNAAHIQTGTLVIGGPGTPGVDTTLLVVRDSSGQEIASWTTSGAVFTDPANTNLKIRILNGALEFSNDGGVNWATAITAQGIKADAITFGTSIGGHNLIPNSQFELAAYSQLASMVWTLNAHFAAVLASSAFVGVEFTGDTLSLINATY